MERTTFSLLFYIRRDKLNKRGEAPVFMRLTINGERADASIKRFIEPHAWNSDKGKANEKCRGGKDLNLYLNAISANILQIQRVPPTCGRRPARGCLCPLPAAHRCGRLRPHAGRRRGVRTLHRPHCGAADAPLAGDGAGAQRRGAGPDRPGVASGLPLPAGQHLVD